MPLLRRIIEPIRLDQSCQRVSVADAHNFSHLEKLNASHNNSLVGAVEQLASVVHQAAYLFDDLTWECENVTSRTDELVEKIAYLSEAVVKLDEEAPTKQPTEPVSYSRLTTEDYYVSKRPSVCDQLQPATRPPYIQALYDIANITPAACLQALYHPDGLTSAQRFVVTPVFLGGADEDDCLDLDLKPPRSCVFHRPEPRIREPKIHERSLHDDIPTSAKDRHLSTSSVLVRGDSMRGRKKSRRRQTVSGAPEVLQAFGVHEHARTASEDRWLRPRSLVLDQYSLQGHSRESTPVSDCRSKEGSLRRSSSFRKSLRSFFSRSRSKSTDLWVSTRSGSPGPPVVDLARTPTLKRSTSLPRSLKSALRGSLNRLMGSRSSSTDDKLDSKQTDKRTDGGRKSNDLRSSSSRSSSRLGLFRSQSQISRSRSMDVHRPRVLEPGPPVPSTMYANCSDSGHVRVSVPPDKPWVSSFVDVRLRCRLNHENSRSSSGNWSASSSSTRQSLESDPRCFVSSPRHLSQVSLDKDSALSLNIHSPESWYMKGHTMRSLPSSEDVSTLNGDTSYYNGDSSSSTTITGGDQNGSVCSLRSRVTPDRDTCSAIYLPPSLTQRNLAAHDGCLLPRVRRYLCEDETSVYSMDLDDLAACSQPPSASVEDSLSRRCVAKKSDPAVAKLSVLNRRSSGRKVPPPPPPRVSTCTDKEASMPTLEKGFVSAGEADAQLLAQMDSITEVSHEADQSMSSVDDSVLPSGREATTSNGYSTWPRSPRGVGIAKPESILKSSQRSRERPPRTLNFAVNTQDAQSERCTAAPTDCRLGTATENSFRSSDTVSDSGTDTRSCCSSDPSTVSFGDEQLGVPTKYQPCITVRPGGRNSTGSTWPRSKAPLLAAPAQLIISSPLAGTAATVQNPHKRSVCSPVNADDFVHFGSDTESWQGSLPRPGKANVMEPSINVALPCSQLAGHPTRRRLASQPLYESIDAMKHSITFPVAQRNLSNCSNYDRTWYDGVRAAAGRLPSQTVLRTEGSTGIPLSRRRRDSAGSSVSTLSSGSGRKSVSFRATSQQVLAPGSSLHRSSSSCSSGSGSHSSGLVFQPVDSDVVAAVADVHHICPGTVILTHTTPTPDISVASSVINLAADSTDSDTQLPEGQSPTFHSFSKGVNPVPVDSGPRTTLKFEDVPLPVVSAVIHECRISEPDSMPCSKQSVKLYPWSSRPSSGAKKSVIVVSSSDPSNSEVVPSDAQTTTTTASASPVEALTTVAYSTISQPKVSSRVQQHGDCDGSIHEVTSVDVCKKDLSEPDETIATVPLQNLCSVASNEPDVTSQSPSQSICKSVINVTNTTTTTASKTVSATTTALSSTCSTAVKPSKLASRMPTKTVSRASPITTRKSAANASSRTASCTSQSSTSSSSLTSPLSSSVTSSKTAAKSNDRGGQTNKAAAKSNSIASVIAARVTAYEKGTASKQKTCETQSKKPGKLKTGDTTAANKSKMVEKGKTSETALKSEIKTEDKLKETPPAENSSEKTDGNVDANCTMLSNKKMASRDPSVKNNAVKATVTSVSTTRTTPRYMSSTDSSRNAVSQRAFAAGRRLLQKKTNGGKNDATTTTTNTKINNGSAKIAELGKDANAVGLKPSCNTEETTVVRILPRIKVSNGDTKVSQRRSVGSKPCNTVTNGHSVGGGQRRSTTTNPTSNKSTASSIDSQQKARAAKISFLSSDGISSNGVMSSPRTPRAVHNSAPLVKVYCKY